jgi:HlyD family secretion protein
VFVVSDNVARRRAIEVVKRNDAEFEVLGGLDAGTVVVLHPSERVADGQRVTGR